MTIWLTILGMALVTYLTRATMLLILRGELAPWLRGWLHFVPVAVFSALIVPAILLQEGANGRILSIGPALPACLVAALVAWRSASLPLTIASGMLVFWLLRWAF